MLLISHTVPILQDSVKECSEKGEEYVKNQNKNSDVVELKVVELRKLWDELNSAMAKRGLLIEVLLSGEF